MGGHGGSSGYSKMSKAASELADLKMKVQNGEDIPEGYSKAKKSILMKYGIESGPDGAGAVLKAAEDIVAERKKKAAQEAAPENIKNLAGQAGNPWPPNADDKHLEYEGGGGLGIWHQLGGGVKNGGVSSQTAKDMDSAIKGYTDGDYGSMRDAFAEGDTTSHYGKQAQLVQSFIEKGIETGNGWTGGATYRGIGGLSDSTWSSLVSLKAGDPIDCNLSAPASWSTNRSTSEHFGSSHNHITFVHLGPTQKGVSVDRISSCKGENEVLVSGKAKYRVVAVSPTQKFLFGSQTYIYVEDVD